MGGHMNAHKKERRQRKESQRAGIIFLFLAYYVKDFFDS